MGFAINGAEFRVYEVKIYPPLPLYAGFLGVEGVSHHHRFLGLVG